MTTPPQVEYRIIKLTKGQICYVSPHRYDRAIHFKWFAHWNRLSRKFYAARMDVLPNGDRYMIYMHRDFLGLNYGNPIEGDHVDHNRTLDNTDKNIRLSDKHDQHHNQGKRLDNSSGYKGVSYVQSCKLWRAQIKINGKNKSLGYYKTSYEAYLAYCYTAAACHGDFVCFG